MSAEVFAADVDVDASVGFEAVDELPYNVGVLVHGLIT